eukprot:scaffold71318_cov43-Prasinocladus_malaysianus.AAC.1
MGAIVAPEHPTRLCSLTRSSQPSWPPPPYTSRWAPPAWKRAESITVSRLCLWPAGGTLPIV